MQRYMVEFEPNQHVIKITNDDVHHIRNVMRMKVGDECVLSNNEQAIYAKIIEMTVDYVVFERMYEVKNNNELPIEVCLAQGLPKADKFEWIIQKVTELGVIQIIPIGSERSIIKLDKERMEKKALRYQKIIKEAAEQSHRVKVPTLMNVMTVKEMIEYAKEFPHKFVAYEGASRNESIKQSIKQIKPGEKVIVFIGPEGGISDKEIKYLKENDFKTISLGQRILRTETAPLVFMSIVIYELEM